MFSPSTPLRYSELNIKYSSSHRKYNEPMQSFLKDMPRRIADHISQEYENASSYCTEDIITAGEGLFHVKSQTDGTQHHTVLFGSQHVMPLCTCKDWEQHKLPCRHFCAIFRLVEGWGWNRLGSIYRDNPLLRLDTVCLGTTNTEQHTDTTAEHNSTICDVNQEPPLPLWRSQSKTKLQMECAGYLEEIIDLTYHLEDETYMTQLAAVLQNILLEVKTHSTSQRP